jgi:amino acid adenylation domain-containing protein
MSKGVTLPETPVLTPKAELPGCIHEIFEAQARKTPNAVAVSFHQQQLTYRELNEQANKLANYLKQLGVRAETPVALYLERTQRMVVSILAVFKAGGTYVPIDLAYPQDRLSFMLQDAQPLILITEESLRAKLPERTPPLVCLDTDWATIWSQSPEAPEAGIAKNNAAYIIYTSGSTGKPKGVVVTHHNVVRLLRETEHWYHFNSTDVWPLFHSYAFDVSVWELWGCLFYGGRLVVVPYLITRSPAEFYELLAREKVTVLNQTPSAFRQLIWAEAQASGQRDLSLRYVICAGEALELQSLKPWFERHGDEKPQIVNKYGITETTVHSTYRVIRKSDLTNGMGSVIGVPIPDLRIYLVDEDLELVPAGTPGEICVGGAGVARGYLNRPELTGRRFLPDPYSDEPGARLYRSGDLAQINSNGELEYLGRMDHQVKIRGFRVELGEIESALNGHAGIRESVVIAQDTPAGDKRLVAYVVPVQTAPTVTDLREHLGRKLPDYMIPAAFLFLNSLPLTTNGKVDRRALPSPGRTRPQLKAEYEAPRSPQEEALAQIWSAVLEIEGIGVHDNFFELGGDSIRSITILSRAQQAGLCFTLQQLFQNPTIAQLTACDQNSEPKPVFQPTEPFSLLSAEDRAKLPSDVEDAYPIAALQLGMFFWNELDPASAMYHDVFSYRIQAAFDSSKLATALQQLAQRHPMLRTSFHIADFTQPLQLVHRQGTVPFTQEDLRHLALEEQEKRLVDWVELEKRRPFDRTVAALVRFHAQVRDSTSFQLIMSFHHACLDGWSLAAVITEICRDYAALLEEREAMIPKPRINYRDFVQLERQAIASGPTREFWSRKLEGATAQLLPRWPKPIRLGGREQKRGPEIQIEQNVLAGLKNLAQQGGVPLKTVLLAAHQRVMALLYGQEDVITGLICNGRPEQLDGEKVVGLFLNSLPLRQRIGGGTWADLVRQTFAEEQQIVPHRRFPLAEIKKLSGGQSLFETAFDFVHFHVYQQLQGCRGLDLAEGHYFEANNLTTYTTFMLDVTSTRLELHIDYDPNELCLEQIERMNHYYVNTLRAMAADPHARYDSFLPLSEAECTEMLLDWNLTGLDYLSASGLADLFEHQVRRTPEAIALVFGNESLTYRQLNDRAEILALALGGLNLAPEELVGIYLERSPQMVVGLLGILKAGGAYLPLDPTYPKERLAFMLDDSKVRLLLTQRALIETIPPSTTQLLCVDDVLCGRGAEAEVAPPANPSRLTHNKPRSERLAYVIYTSGSTGNPKGVMVNQGSVINLLVSAARTAAVSDRDNLLAVTTLSFDIAGLEIFMPLITGGRLTLASREQAGDGSQLSALIASARPTVMQATPATWRLLIEAGWTGDKDLTIFCGGEALKRELADELLSRVKEVWNFYGPTETTIWSTAWKVVPGEPITIGRPLGNTQIYILDSQLRPVPVGTAGELHIGGAGLARGYLQRDELTSEKFIPNPFAATSGERLYKTGDLARYLPNGTIECLGRLDHQVKIRGFRIELGEVETVLRQHNGIADAVVTARDDSLGEKRLVGYLISRNGPPSTVELREFARTKLPLYMVPAQFVLLQEFPLTPNGKIDLRRLPAPDSASNTGRNYIAPRNTDEQSLATIWQEVLMLKQVGIDDDFFELGGDSLSATRAFARTNQAFGTSLTLREMLDHPTIRTLSELVARSKGTAPVRPPILPRSARPARSASM